MSSRRPPLHNRVGRKPLRQKLRTTSTGAEAVLWKSLQRRQILGRKFRRQHSIGPYVVDFYCPECCLVVELDGAPHYSILADEYEGNRTRYLLERGVRILRFENRLVFEALESVLETIRRELA